ncbi:type II toxin-antitoxin system HicA family toxin [Salinivibrio socompensis]|uniref:type II toxin-antitoxin system HicA family toxin n=1 Tax=Salinivibrio socompensis TaxID=1510206 RepID=UPI000471EB77
MTKAEKLLQKLKSIPNDFTWNELKSVLERLEFEEVQGSGSRVKFIRRHDGRIINLHKPHPGNIMKKYALRIVIAELGL